MFSDYENKHKGEQIYVIGASSHMNHVNRAFFDGKITVGCNFAYKNYPIKYTISKHWGVIKEWVPKDKPDSMLFHPKYTTDMGGFEIQEIGTFFPADEFYWPRTIMGAAIDFARYLGAREIIVFGAQSNGEYMDKYKGMTDNISREIFMLQADKNIRDLIELIWLKYGVWVTRL